VIGQPGETSRISVDRVGILSPESPVFDPKIGAFRRFAGLRGVSDILGILPQNTEVSGYDQPQTFGNLLAIEVKRPGKKPTDDQACFLAEVNRRGGIGVCVHGVDELERELEQYL